jgi:hypothetical protein
MLRPMLAALALTAAALSARADDHPFKNVKVGDSTTYTSTLKSGGSVFTGETTQTVTAKTDAVVTIKLTGFRETKGMKFDLGSTTIKIDIAEPFDPQKFADFPFGGDPKLEPGKESNEKIKIGGKEYNCTVMTYSLTSTTPAEKYTSQIKVWTCKDVPMGVAKMTMVGMPSGEKSSMTLEWKSAGGKK